MSLRPLHDRVIVRKAEEESTTAGGIVLPGSASEKPQHGEVLAVGPGKRDDNGARITPDVEVGDKVVFGQYSGSTVKIDGEEVLILNESDILAVVS